MYFKVCYGCENNHSIEKRTTASFCSHNFLCFFVFIFFPFTSSRQVKKVPIPVNIISEEKVVALWWVSTHLKMA